MREFDCDTIASIRARTCLVPLDPPVQTASGTVPVAPLVLVDITTASGVTGSSYVFTFSPIALKPVADLILGMEPIISGHAVAPVSLHDMLEKRFRLLGTEGLVLMAIAAIDMAVWDALARLHGQPLVRLLGCAPSSIAAYASLRTMKPEDVAREAEAMAKQGFTAFKFKVGWPDVHEDIAAVRALRSAVGAKAAVMVDYNQSLSVPEAKRRVRMLDELDLGWIEEPVLMADLSGQAEIRLGANTPIQAGENWWGPHDAMKSINAGATDLMMPDVMKIGGVTGWLRTAALAQAAGIPVSSHLFPEVSAHCLAATPTAHCLEFLDLAGPLLATPLTLKAGTMLLPEAPGSGIEWNEVAIEQFAA